jgi:hypothetical protein
MFITIGVSRRFPRMCGNLAGVLRIWSPPTTGTHRIFPVGTAGIWGESFKEVVEIKAATTLDSNSSPA